MWSTKLTSLSPAGSTPPSNITSSTTSPLHSNGKMDSIQDVDMANGDASYDSGSDLSDIRDPPAAPTSPSTSTSPEQPSEFGQQDLHSSDASDAEMNEASDDADFDMEDASLATTGSSRRQDRSASHDSRKAHKRKLGIEDDEHILANPALYGLRRSVSVGFRASLHPLTHFFRADPCSIVQS